METVLCGSTAYRYWRTPPIVLYLAAAPVDSPALRQFLREEELLAFRADLADRLPFLRECTGPSWRNVGQAARDIRDARWLLAPSANFPLDVLAQERGGRRSSGLISTTFWNGGLPFEATCDVTDDLGVTSPAFTMVQMAAQAGFTRTLLLASELCGSYAVYPAPEPIRSLLQRIASRGRLKAFNGWRPCLSGEGNVTDLWRRDPLTTPDDLKAMAEAAEGHRGAAALRKVADAVVPLAASPFETQAGLLLSLPGAWGARVSTAFRTTRRLSSAAMPSSSDSVSAATATSICRTGSTSSARARSITTTTTGFFPTPSARPRCASWASTSCHSRMPS